MRLASDNRWTQDRFKHLSWRSRWSCVHLNREWQFHAKSHELIGAFLACHPDWAQGPPALCAEHGLPLPGCWTIIVPFLRILFRRLSMLTSFWPLSGNSLSTVFVHHTALTDRFLITIPSSYKISTILFNFYWYLDLDSSFPKVK